MDELELGEGEEAVVSAGRKSVAKVVGEYLEVLGEASVKELEELEEMAQP